MSDPADDFLEAAESGDPAALLAHQTDAELRALARHAQNVFRSNTTKGGFPRDLLALCCMEAAKRFLTPPPA
jgi:hypothetical protein